MCAVFTGVCWYTLCTGKQKILTNMLRAVMEKVYNMEEQMDTEAEK